jgi:hypothetical protein
VLQYPLRDSAILDSGTTLHIFNQISRFLNFRPAPYGDHVVTGDGEAPILGYGDVDILVDGPKGKRAMRLYGAAFCEGFACNLVSLQKLLARGLWWDTRQENNCLRHTDDDEVLCSIRKAHDQFVLEYLPKAHSQQAFFTRRNRINSWTKRKPQGADAKMWHLRLGHLGLGALEHLVNSTQGVRIKGITTVECDGCGLGKAHRMVRREPRDVEGGPGMRLAVDFHDFEPDSHGYQSLMLVTDRWSGYIWDYYLERRTASAIIGALEHLRRLLHTQYGFQIKVIECDNEIAEVKSSVKHFVGQHGIRMEPSAPYTQAQNGGAERSGGVVKEKARAMAQGAHLPSGLWTEVSRAAVYLLNRTPRYQYHWKTPYERLHLFVSNRDGVVKEHQQPQQAHLKVYGCKAFALTKEALKKSQRRKRLEPKAWIGYLVGYNSTNIYRVWNPITAQVVSTRDVMFNEDEVFNGDLEGLKKEALQVSLEELSKLLTSIAQPQRDELPAEPVTTRPEMEFIEIEDDEPIEDEIVVAWGEDW